ncbi:protein TolQ [Novosphingobium sp. FSW06-99]|uniref:protein TolQ n=1 Tax=Novosphingobium sp. FSW06-99 TaxID=1739113 RepID=UPI00076D739A|nr:protein TolQ [Novosphingobium sp. FSW06-99]KUR74943.1 protein TolQ [Novosphingobium sp. FSW06-99]
MMLAMLAESAIGAPTRLNPVELFLHADVVVQAVIGGLVLASIWVWMIIVGFTVRMGLIGSRCRKYEDGFWSARDIDAYQKDQGKKDIPTARVVTAALAEWRRSTSGKTIDRDGTRQRLAAAMDGAVTEETDQLARRLNFLATVGSVAPFVGLFGTVWGVMDSFFRIGAMQNSSLAVVAPGISEALFATAIGLFAAIPAVVAYNRFSFRVNAFEASLFRFTDRFHGTLSRELEQ